MSNDSWSSEEGTVPEQWQLPRRLRDDYWPVMFGEYVGHLAKLVVEDWGARRDSRSVLGWLIPAAVAAAAALTVLWLLITVVTWIARGLGEAVGQGGQWLHDWAFARLVLTPVRTYLNSHASGLPIDSATLWWTWAAAGVALFVLSWVAASIGARIGWALYGAATAGMVWTATGPPADWTATGLAALWWALLSVLTFRRRIWTRRR